jgi:hypothetical protein
MPLNQAAQWGRRHVLRDGVLGGKGVVAGWRGVQFSRTLVLRVLLIRSWRS